MKIALINEYYPPFMPGGAEWSTYYLKENLLNEGIEVVVITPQYRKLTSTEIKKYSEENVVRFPLPLGKFLDEVVSPFWLNNPIFWLYSSFWLMKLIYSKKISVIHVHSKNMIPGSVISGFITNKPVVVTFREKTILCPYNYCLSNNKLIACSLKDFILEDHQWYFHNYTNKTTSSYWLSLISGIYGWVTCRILQFFAKYSTLAICISEHDKKVYQANGFKDIKVIYNSIDFPGIKKIAKLRKVIVYAGKLSLGKGVPLLLDAFVIFHKKFPQYHLELIGSGKISNNDSNLKTKIRYLGKIDHHELLQKISTATLVVMPSITVESFGRVALEAISRGTPAVVTNIGGLPEIIKNDSTGYIVDPNANSLANGLERGIKNNSRIRQSIANQYLLLTKKFGVDTTKQYIKIYRNII